MDCRAALAMTAKGHGLPRRYAPRNDILSCAALYEPSPVIATLLSVIAALLSVIATLLSVIANEVKQSMTA